MPKYALPIPLHQIVFKQRIEQYGNASKIIHLNMESRLAGEQVSHILRSDLRHTEQVVCIGTHSKGVELLVRKVAAKRDDRMILAGYFGGNRGETGACWDSMRAENECLKRQFAVGRHS